MANAPLEVTPMREHCRRRCAETEDGILDHGLATAHGGNKVPVVIEMITITLRRQVLLGAVRAHGVGDRRTHRVLLVIFAEKLLLNTLWKSLDRVTGLLLARVSRHRHAAADGEDPSLPTNRKPELSPAPSTKFTRNARLNAGWVFWR